MQIRVCRYKNVGVAGYAEAFMPVQSNLQTSEWYSYFENDVLVLIEESSVSILRMLYALIAFPVYN